MTNAKFRIPETIGQASDARQDTALLHLPDQASKAAHILFYDTALAFADQKRRAAMKGNGQNPAPAANLPFKRGTGERMAA
jgi:hypothetical protein